MLKMLAVQNILRRSEDSFTLMYSLIQKYISSCHSSIGIEHHSLAQLIILYRTVKKFVTTMKKLLRVLKFC